MNSEDCPVKTISLFSKMRQLESLGVVSCRPVFREGMGPGEEFVHDGEKVCFMMGVVGQPSDKWKGLPEGTSFDMPHDVAVNPVTCQVLAFARSL